MNPLPRFVAMALFVVLVALVALLAVPVWQGFRAESAAGKPGTTVPTATTEPRPHAPANRALVLTQRGALVLAGTGLILTVALILSQALRAKQAHDSQVVISAVRTEADALTRLAKSSVAQSEELSRERDVRRRAEEDARLKQQLLEQSLDEKIRLGRDLHDGIIQSLYAAGLTLETIRPLVRSNPDEAEQRLEKMRSGLNSAIRDVRAYIVGLAPDNLRRAGFARAVTAQLSELQAGREARFDVQIDDEAAALLSSEQSVEFLQIAREAVSNAFRHGAATVLTLRLQKSDQELCLLVQDNGSGFTTKRHGRGGHGLGNMEARAARLGATLHVTSTPGQGTRVLATLPIFNSAAS